MDFRLLSSRVRTSGDGVAGDTAITECDERVAQWCGEPARLARVQKHERELGMFFCVCAMRFPACGSAWKMDSGSPENSGSEQFQFFWLRLPLSSDSQNARPIRGSYKGQQCCQASTPSLPHVLVDE